VTISAATEAANENRDALAMRVWGDVAKALALPESLPPDAPAALPPYAPAALRPYAIVRERLATFAATPAQDARRPPARTRWNNLFLAGDWTATGLPSTIEGSLRAGAAAADLVFSRQDV